MPDVEVRVEVASLAGRVAAVKAIFPWTKPDREPAKSAVGAAVVGPLVLVGCRSPQFCSD